MQQRLKTGLLAGIRSHNRKKKTICQNRFLKEHRK
nr:MAG TPA: hypothetical protein [Caudoviricetes sp.]